MAPVLEVVVHLRAHWSSSSFVGVAKDDRLFLCLLQAGATANLNLSRFEAADDAELTVSVLHWKLKAGDDAFVTTLRRGKVRIPRRNPSDPLLWIRDDIRETAG